MSYNFKNIEGSETIGNSLSTVNSNYKNLELWTNNIIFSSVNYFKPLLNFYLFYGDFWKQTINYAYSLDAPRRLSAFQTTVETNSATWIKPITFTYPTIQLFNPATLNSNLNTALTWFRTNFPVLPQQSNARPFYAENTRAFLYCIFYEEIVRINASPTLTRTRNCRTENRTAIANCHVIWQDNVSCYGARVCPQYSWRAGRAPTCRRAYTANCSYENGQRAIDRSLIVNINNFFRDRFEHQKIYCLQLRVQNCQWVIEKIL